MAQIAVDRGLPPIDSIDTVVDWCRNVRARSRGISHQQSSKSEAGNETEIRAIGR